MVQQILFSGRYFLAWVAEVAAVVLVAAHQAVVDLEVLAVEALVEVEVAGVGRNRLSVVSYQLLDLSFLIKKSYNYLILLLIEAGFFIFRP